ncbi:MAG: AhpC/TSA family protein [Bacteroidaceae bacterium]|nr:AhpC/TSA family protein [Bacteroidaceae bacterium]
MRNKILSIIAVAGCMAVSAQETCIITGSLADNQLADGKKVKKVYLTRTNEFGVATTVATAKVKKDGYTFKYKLTPDEPVMQYTITGFGDSQGIDLFVEPGEIAVATPSAIHPEHSTVVGTPTNDTYTAYKAIAHEAACEAARQIAALEQQHGKEWLESKEGKSAVKRIKAAEAVNAESQSLRFLIDHHDSPMTPLVAEQTLLPKFSAAYAEQITKSIALSLQDHPYYHSLRNTMLANSLKVGNEAPDITLPMLIGDTKHLTDYRGKYILLHFWAEGEKSADTFAELQHVYEVVKEHPEQFMILSISLDSDVSAWEKAVKSYGVDRTAWLHACDGVGPESPAAKRYGIAHTPQIVFIEPEGHAISLNMDLDEITMRIEQILMGDLYYLDQEK